MSEAATQTPPATLSPPVPAAPPIKPYSTRRAARWVIGGIIVLFALAFAIRWIIESLRTVSTDDAYVDGHVTFVAARVPGQVLRVLVDDNNRVRKGDLLVQLDPEPYQVQLNIAQSEVDVAQTNLIAAQAEVRADAGKARAARFSL